MSRAKLGAWIISIVFVVLLLFPLYIMFKISVSAPHDVFRESPPYFIENFTWQHFRNVLASGEAFYAPLSKSFITAIAATFLSLLIAVPAAYGISRFDVKLRYILILIIFMSRMVPEVSIALPISITFIRMGLFDTTLGLVLAHLIRILPVSCFILVSVFGEFPLSLERQARIDGYSRIGAIRKVVLPLSLTGLVVAGLFSFILSWDEFIYASYLTLAEPTMPIKMYYYISRGNIFSSATYAVIITIPVLIITFSLQRYIKPEYLSGSVKG
ncbi:MAG: ABC transporter permease subunit [Candidatus Omnitrophica bacterium]|nr:ABC transporter permease subunit [Candidatus Omnitrophota bacterium]MBD3269078.1 ABC transporter permease subunit [Candidatus Omnitrophota bacterium]